MAVEPAIQDARTTPEAGLWSRLAGTADAAFLESWLELQCRQVPEARSGLLLSRDGAGALAPAALWPHEQIDLEPLAELAARAAQERCGLVRPVGGPHALPIPGQPNYLVSFPVTADGEVVAVVTLAVVAAADEVLRRILSQLQWGGAWLEVQVQREARARQAAQTRRMSAADDLLACVLGEPRYKHAGMRFVSELATLLDCDRVTLGYVRGHRVKVRLLSHSAQFGKRMNLMRAVGAAMEEAVEQRRVLIWPLPPEEEVFVVREHARLSELTGAGSVLTVPLYREGGYYAVLTLERSADQPFTRDDAHYVEGIAALVTAALEDKRLNDRWLVVKALDALRVQAGRLLGPRYMGRKLAVVLLAAVVAFFAVAERSYNLSADATLQGAVQRVVAAPFDGYIQDAAVRAGDIAREGEVLVRLDDRDLRLERLKWRSQAAKLERQLQEALGGRERARIGVIRAQLEQVEAELELVERRLQRSVLRAPFDGVVVGGDLSQRLGSSVKQGDVLFEIAPLDAYRIQLQVAEGRIEDVQVGQRGRLLLASLPREPFPFRVTKITPVTEVVEGATAFRVEGELTEGSERLRPGMEGVGKIHVDRRLLIDIWTRDLREWARLRWWAFWG